MFHTIVKIKPVPVYLNYLRISEVYVKINEGAVIQGTYMIDEEKGVEPFQIPVPKEDYDQWGSDDSFIITYTLQKLGLEADNSYVGS